MGISDGPIRYIKAKYRWSERRECCKSRKKSLGDFDVCGFPRTPSPARFREGEANAGFSLDFPSADHLSDCTEPTRNEVHVVADVFFSIKS